MTVSRDLPVGYQFPPVTRVMSQERMAVFSDMEHSNTAGIAGRMQLAPKNIHNNDEFARSQGLPRTIADGLISTAWIEAQLRDLFGEGYVRGGRLLTKFIKPVFSEDVITIKMSVQEKTGEDGAIRLVLDIRCYNQDGLLVTVGTGSGLVR